MKLDCGRGFSALQGCATICLLVLFTLSGCIGLHSGRVGPVHEEAAFTKRVEKVYFDSGKYNLKGSGKKVLLGLVERMQKDESVTLTIVGHTDSVGTEECSRDLGAKRANAVKQFLLGCDRSLVHRIYTQSRGMTEPEVLVYSSDASEVEKANAQNRRAVIIIHSAATPHSYAKSYGISRGNTPSFVLGHQ
ncbi:OmpA family protein [Candidatus Anaplasma sp. TIGMIC]|uniref:OmpA family protein n=1 Tax=Candidatus Anaplasma sp. TIGMIC TaxID=3020713 RepID=UPI00232C3ED1|nr:OmpA family protein [Candidatus Anaplasma sp. TIGMIC]MDB1135027.1 OmpA family protein [Candidatus Anaplasma sp. TIGMIC]